MVATLGPLLLACLAACSLQSDGQCSARAIEASSMIQLRQPEVPSTLDLVEGAADKTLSVQDELIQTASGLEFQRAHNSGYLGMSDAEILGLSAWPPAGPGTCLGQTEKEHVTAPFQKLALIHIPRSGGTSIEDCSMGELSGTEMWGRHAEDLVKDHQRCTKQHVPPNLLEYFKGKETFCVVRNPYTRLISEYGYMCGNAWGTWGEHGDNVETMNEKLLEALRNVKEHPQMYDCHLMPMAAYVYGWNTDSDSVDTSTQHCDNVLRFEKGLQEEFNGLMQTHGYTYHLNSTAYTRSNDKFRFLPENLSAEVVRFANEIFHVDFDLFNYSKLSVR